MSGNLFITILINLIITNCVSANKRDESMEMEDSIRKSIEMDEMVINYSKCNICEVIGFYYIIHKDKEGRVGQ